MTSVLSLVVMRLQRRHTDSTVLLAGGWDGQVVARRTRLRDRLAARLRRRRLDRALASGTPPEASAPLALRAQQLTETRHRGTIAHELRRVLWEAQHGAQPSLGRIMPSRMRVSDAREELGRLAETLDDPGPVAAGGVARAWLLLTDGTGSLYNPGSGTPLRVDAARALRELRPWPA